LQLRNEKNTNNIISSASISLFFIALSQKYGTPVGNIQIFRIRTSKGRSQTCPPSPTQTSKTKNAREKKMTSEYVKYLPILHGSQSPPGVIPSTSTTPVTIS
jgi:hypothetical protein